MKLVWKLTIINAILLVTIMMVILVLYYTSVKSAVIKEQETFLKNWARTFYLFKGNPPTPPKRNFYNTRRFPRNFPHRRVYVEVNSKVLNDPFGITGKIMKGEKIQKIGEEYYLSVFIEKDHNKIHLATNITSLITAINLMFRNFAIISIIGIGISVLIAYWIASYALRPIKQLSRKLSTISAENLSKRLPVPNTKDELAQLVRSINEMLERIENSYRVQKQFVHDVSHELRTPITSIKGFIRVLEKWGYKDEKIFNEAVKELKNLTDEIINLINNLLILAKPKELTYDTVNLRELVNDIVKILNNEHDKEITIIGEANLNTSKEHIKIVLKNLIENALKFSKSRVKITIEHDKITIDDDGPGIPISEREKIFEKFYRSNKSRDKRISGHGIGLSIVKEICDILGFEIEVSDSDLGGARFIIKWKRKTS